MRRILPALACLLAVAATRSPAAPPPAVRNTRPPVVRSAPPPAVRNTRPPVVRSAPPPTGSARIQGPPRPPRPPPMRRPPPPPPRERTRVVPVVVPVGAAPGAYGYPAPYVSNVHYDADGRVSGYHVVSPGVESNPFAALPVAVQGASAPAAPAVETVRIERHPVAPPSVAVAETREEDALRTKLADRALTYPSAAFTDEQFDTHGLPLAREQYRAGPDGPVPAFALRTGDDGRLARVPAPDAAGLPVADDDALRAAFRAGFAFTLVRPRSVALPCGMCEGRGAIVSERVVVEGSPDVRTVTAPCPRCSGSGTVAREIDAAYSVRRKND